MKIALNRGGSVKVYFRWDYAALHVDEEGDNG